MVLFLIGLGLGGPDDVTVKGLKIIQQAAKVYLEAYTSILSCGQAELEEFYGRSVILADRDMVEQGSNNIFELAKTEDVAFLVIGDPFGATTHSDLILRAIEESIPYKVVHNASIMNAIGCCGLQLYSFGETVSIVFWNDNWEPDSFYDKIESNLRRGLHTLCLLDIKVKEQTVENMMRGRKVYEPPRYMTANTACSQLLKIIERKTENGEKPALTCQTTCVALSRVGWDDQRIVAAPLGRLVDCDLGRPLHSLVVAGNLHPLEVDFIKQFEPAGE